MAGQLQRVVAPPRDHGAGERSEGGPIALQFEDVGAGRELDRESISLRSFGTRAGRDGRPSGQDQRDVGPGDADTTEGVGRHLALVGGPRVARKAARAALDGHTVVHGDACTRCGEREADAAVAAGTADGAVSAIAALAAGDVGRDGVRAGTRQNGTEPTLSAAAAAGGLIASVIDKDRAAIAAIAAGRGRGGGRVADIAVRAAAAAADPLSVIVGSAVSAGRPNRRTTDAAGDRVALAAGPSLAAGPPFLSGAATTAARRSGRVPARAAGARGAARPPGGTLAAHPTLGERDGTEPERREGHWDSDQSRGCKQRDRPAGATPLRAPACAERV
ncbi:hypothetical protein KHHGKMAE_3847 [Methylobacterium persicinum]|nr:hypothetical protein KHHGKMAE_3847 [Methylobacterium persicinum]